MKESNFTTKEVAELAGVPVRTLSSWVEGGIIRPEGYIGRHRTPIPWTEKEVREVCILAQLRKTLSMQSLREAMDYLRDELGHNPLSTGSFAVIDAKKKRLVKICGQNEAIEIIGKTQGQLLLPLDISEITDSGVIDGE